MLPGLSLDHIIILGVIALVVVGPKDLPLLLRKLGMWTARLRGMAQEFRSGFDELARQAELDELKKEVEALRRTTSLSSISNEMTKPLGTLESYAGFSPPPPPAPSPAVVKDEPSVTHAPPDIATAPQSPPRDDSASVHEEQSAPAVQRTAT